MCFLLLIICVLRLHFLILAPYDLQLSSCYLTTVPDDLDGIFNAIHDNAMLSKWAGGLGNDWTQVRAIGSHIRGTNGKSQGGGTIS